jgi:hypothetical protein
MNTIDQRQGAELDRPNSKFVPGVITGAVGMVLARIFLGTVLHLALVALFLVLIVAGIWTIGKKVL